MSIACYPKTTCRKVIASYSDSSLALDVHGLAVSLAGLDGLARLLDLLEDGLVGKRVGSLDLGGLGLEGDVVGLNTCEDG
jgi:hypothetical protein